MYTIGEAAARSGLSVATMRAWERRYGIVHPVRTAGGYRIYDDAAIARLSAMRALVAAGWRPSQAALHAAEAAGASQAAAQRPRAAHGSEGPLAQSGDAVAAAVVRATAAMDPLSLESALDEAFGRTTFERAIADVIAPAMQEVGQAWAEGRLDVAAEHAASHALLRRLSALYDATGQPPRAPQVLVGLPAGARHEAGALAFAIAARRGGLSTLYLGPDLPDASWLSAIDQTGAAAMVVAVPTADDEAAAARLVEVVTSSRPSVAVFVGGPAAVGTAMTGLSEPLPENLTAAVARLRGIVAGRREPAIRTRRAVKARR